METETTRLRFGNGWVKEETKSGNPWLGSWSKVAGVEVKYFHPPPHLHTFGGGSEITLFLRWGYNQSNKCTQWNLSVCLLLWMYFYRACQGGSHCILEALLAEVLLFVFSTYTLHYPTQVSHVTVSCRAQSCSLHTPSFLPYCQKRLGESLHSQARWILVISNALTLSDIRTAKEHAGEGQDMISCPCQTLNSMKCAHICIITYREWMERGVSERGNGLRKRYTKKEDWRALSKKSKEKFPRDVQGPH